MIQTRKLEKTRKIEKTTTCDPKQYSNNKSKIKQKYEKNGANEPVLFVI